MRILFVEPAFHSFMNYDRWYYPTSLAQLAAICYMNNHETYIYDADRYFFKSTATKNRIELLNRQQQYFEGINDFDHEIWQHYLSVLKEYNPEVVGVSVFTCKFRSALNALKIAKEYNPQIHTCIGGAHVTALPDTFLSKKYIDGVFQGYSDATFPKWIEDGCPKGIIRSNANEINLKELPYPRRQALLSKEFYTPRDFGMVIASRGCVAQCKFCSNSFLWEGRPFYRETESVRNEIIELLDEWGVNSISLTDSSNSDFHVEAKRIANILKEFNVPWTTNVRWATVTKELLEHFIKCGCSGISVGLEAGSDKILKYMKKGCNKKQIREKAQMVNSLGLDWQLFTIVGFPDETAEEMIETRELVLEIKPTSVSVNSLSPLPGTDVWKDVPGITEEMASSVNQLLPNYCFSKYVSLEEYKDIFVTITKCFEAYNSNKVNK